MSIYIIGLGLSVLLLYLANRIKRNQRWVVSIIALLIPCLIAALRANNIGTDTSVYLVQITDAALQSDSFKEYLNVTWLSSWRYKSVTDYEIGFTAIVYLVAKLFHSITAVKFIIQALMIYPIYFALKKMDKERYMWLSFFVYSCMMYNSSYNVMRQFIAMSFVFLAFAYAVQNQYRGVLVFEVIAFLFHTSAVLGILIYGLYVFVNKDTPVRMLKVFRRYSRMIAATFIGLLLIIATNVVARIMSMIGLGGYTGYILGDLYLLPNQILVRLPVFALFFVLWKKMEANEKWNRFLFVMLIYDLICSQFASVLSYSGRITWYFAQFEMITLPSFYLNSKKNKVVLLIIILYLIFYWWYYYVNLNNGNTVPFEFYYRGFSF